MVAEHPLNPAPSKGAKPVQGLTAEFWRRLLLILVCLAISSFYLLFAYRTFVLHYYPSPPFFYDEGDSLADWLNACAWTERTDRYTAWRSLYTPFSHFTCYLFNIFLGFIPIEWFTGWRQFSGSSKLVVALHLLLWLTILLPLQPSKHQSKTTEKRAIINVDSYWLHKAPFKLLTLFSYGALYSFERGNLLSLCFLLFLLKFRFSHYKSLGRCCQPILIGIAAAIKPYILLFSTYGRSLTSLLSAIGIAFSLQIIAILMIGAPGLENLPANLAYFSKDNDITDVLSRSINTFSFRSYIELEKLVTYGESQIARADLLGFSLNLLYGLSLGVFIILLALSIKCLAACWSIATSQEKHTIGTSDRSSASDKHGIASIEKKQWDRKFFPLLDGAAPSCILVLLYLVIAHTSGAYVILFLIASVLAVEEATNLISRSPLLLSLYFLAICAFDMPWLNSKSYVCGSTAPHLNYHPLLTDLLGYSFTCMGSYIGPVSITRPLTTLVFGCVFLAQLHRYLYQQKQNPDQSIQTL